MVVVAAAVVVAAVAAPPSGVAVAQGSNVEWNNPTWASDGTGAMPIGNGDVTSSVWVDGTCVLHSTLYIRSIINIYIKPL